MTIVGSAPAAENDTLELACRFAHVFRVSREFIADNVCRRFILHTLGTYFAQLFHGT
jgi:hypothetical protein